MFRSSRHLAALAVASSAVLVACGESDDESQFKVRNTLGSVSAPNPVVADAWLVYFVDESLVGNGGERLNGDLDTVDAVPSAVRMPKSRESLLPVAAESAAIVAGEVYLVVIEAEDEVDWNGTNGMADTVLVHWSEETGALAYVDTLRAGPPAPVLVATESRLYYASANPLGLPDETSLRRIEPNQPTTPLAVVGAPGAGAVVGAPLVERDGLLFAALDEPSSARDLNGDGDAADACVLGLLDTNLTTATLVSTGLALSDPSSPLDAAVRDQNDWTVAFLVSEAAQGNVSLNDDDPPAFGGPILPATCSANDADADDDVLHYLMLRDFASGTAPAVDTGIAGRTRAFASPDWVATLADEADSTNPCDLNGDLDTSDTVVRWAVTVAPVAPPNDPSQLHAVAVALPGGASGVVRLDERLVCVVDEAADGRDHDGKPEDHDLVAWLDPADGPAALWTFAHQDPKHVGVGTAVFEDRDGDGVPDYDDGASEPYAGAGWMGPDAETFRLAIAFQEEVPGTNPRVASMNNNVDCALVIKDTDLVDVLPVWPDFEGRFLDFDGTGFALDPLDPGIVVAAGLAFFKVDEAADSFDHNADGVLDDRVLMSNPLTTCEPRMFGTLSSLPGPAVFTDGLRGAAFLASEAATGEDFNEDGDASDLVVRYIVF